jgi:hypothetical protein
MRLRLAVTVSLQGTLLLGFCIALTSCPSRPADTRPAIEFSKIPPAAQGGAGKSRYYRGARQKCPPWAADRYLCAQWAVVGAALARSPSNSNSSRFNLEHRNSSGI